MNRVQLMGRLTRDPEVKYTATGTAVAGFTLAVRRYTGANSQKEETDFIDCVVWRVLAENCGNTLQKGQLVQVDGRLQIRSYEAKDGQTRRVAEVVANSVSQPLQSWESKGDRQAMPPDTSNARHKADGEVLPDEDIPF
jgi:single stranded DNA-binding protein (ssb)